MKKSIAKTICSVLTSNGPFANVFISVAMELDTQCVSYGKVKYPLWLLSNTMKITPGQLFETSHHSAPNQTKNKPTVE